MIKTVTKEVHCCDLCGTESSYIQACENCGAEYCLDHYREHLISYPHSMYCSGSGDGRYCKKCIETLTARKDPRLMAYLAIQDLRAEADANDKAFRLRVQAAEDRIKLYSKP